MFTKRRKLNVSSEDTDDVVGVSFIFGVVLIVCLLGLYGIVYAVDKALPTHLGLNDEESKPDAFIAERARNYLKPLTDFGPRIAGGAVNEVKTVNYLKSTIDSIIANANSNQEIELDVQVASGSYYQDYRPYGVINAYANVQNVAVKIYSSTRSNHSVIINTHFDTVPTSPGGSDDGINVAICLEVLTKLSRAKTKPTNNIIFLFNGAEEAGLLGSHAFITQHKWAPEVRVLVNLEATGANGKELLFQTGPDAEWLMKYYDVPHPHANAAGEEIFQSNIIPSDTDFRIFRDFGVGVIGYDMAYNRDGYRYHTKYDGFDNINLGTFQHTGDNVLKLVRNLADAPEVSRGSTGEKQAKSVFFDFLGLFLIHYSNTVAIITNVITILVSIGVTVWTYYDYNFGFSGKGLLFITIICLTTLLGWIISFGVCLLIGTILDAAHRTMSWYSAPFLSVGSYSIPTALIMCTTVWLTNRFVRYPKLSMVKKMMMQIHMTRFIWVVILLIGTCLGLRSVYILLIPIMFNTVAMIIIQGFKLHNLNKVWPAVYIISTILPTIFILYYMHELLAAFIPISGRFGPGTNTEILIGLIVTAFTVLILSYYVPLFAFIHQRWYVMMTLGALFIAWIILVCTPVGFPYTFDENAPKLQRFYIYHTKRIFNDENGKVIQTDAGFSYSHMDRNSPYSLEGIVSSLERQASLENDCKIAVNCGLPVTNSRSLSSLKSSVWIPAGEPNFPSKITYRYTQETLSSTKIKYSFVIEGSDRIDAYLSARSGVKISSVNLVDALPNNYLSWNGQATYYLSFVYGKGYAPFEFNFIVEKPEDFNSPTVDFAIAAKFVHNDQNVKTTDYENFLNEFPDWTIHSATALAYYESIVLR